MLWADNFQDIFVLPVLLYTVAGWYHDSKQYAIGGIYIYRKKMRKQDLTEFSTTVMCCMLRGNIFVCQRKTWVLSQHRALWRGLRSHHLEKDQALTPCRGPRLAMTAISPPASPAAATGWSRISYPRTLPTSRSHQSVSTRSNFLRSGAHLKRKSPVEWCTVLWILKHFGKQAPPGRGLQGTSSKLLMMQRGPFSCQIFTILKIKVHPPGVL